MATGAMIGVVDYGLGNLASVAGAVERLGFEPRVSSDPDFLGTCDKLILPGVGAFGDGMRNLRERGLIEPLNAFVIGKGTPVLGICLGSQLMTRSSEEFGRHDGLGWIDGAVTRIEPDDPGIRVPHVGWNGLEQVRESGLFEGVPGDALFYYVHGYRIQADPACVVGTCEYGGRFVAAFERDNVFGTQFHPEKSQLAGLSLLRNFLGRA